MSSESSKSEYQPRLVKGVRRAIPFEFEKNLPKYLPMPPENENLTTPNTKSGGKRRRRGSSKKRKASKKARKSRRRKSSKRGHK